MKNGFTVCNYSVFSSQYIHDITDIQHTES